MLWFGLDFARQEGEGMGGHSYRMLDAGEEPDEELAKGGATRPIVAASKGRTGVGVGTKKENGKSNSETLLILLAARREARLRRGCRRRRVYDNLRWRRASSRILERL